MEQFIGCDAHKKFSLFVTMDEKGECGRATRVSHEREAFREFLAKIPPGSQIALETSGNYYWLVDAMEQRGTSAAIGARVDGQAPHGRAP